MVWNQEKAIFADRISEVPKYVSWATTADCWEKTDHASGVFAEKKQFIQLPLLTAPRTSFVFQPPLFPQALEGFPFASSLLEKLILLIADLLQAPQFTGSGHTMLRQNALACVGEVQFSGRGSLA